MGGQDLVHTRGQGFLLLLRHFREYKPQRDHLVYRLVCFIQVPHSQGVFYRLVPRLGSSLDVLCFSEPSDLRSPYSLERLYLRVYPVSGSWCQLSKRHALYSLHDSGGELANPKLSVCSVLQPGNEPLLCFLQSRIQLSTCLELFSLGKLSPYLGCGCANVSDTGPKFGQTLSNGGKHTGVRTNTGRLRRLNGSCI